MIGVVFINVIYLINIVGTIYQLRASESMKMLNVNYKYFGPESCVHTVKIQELIPQHLRITIVRYLVLVFIKYFGDYVVLCIRYP